MYLGNCLLGASSNKFMATDTEFVGAEVGNPDDDDVEDLQSTVDDSIDSLLGLDS